MVAERKVQAAEYPSIEIPALRNVDGEVFCVPKQHLATGMKVVRVNLRFQANVQIAGNTIRIPISIVNWGFGGCIQALNLSQWPELDNPAFKMALQAHPKVRKYCSLPIQNWLFEV